MLRAGMVLVEERRGKGLIGGREDMREGTSGLSVVSRSRSFWAGFLWLLGFDCLEPLDVGRERVHKGSCRLTGVGRCGSYN